MRSSTNWVAGAREEDDEEENWKGETDDDEKRGGRLSSSVESPAPLVAVGGREVELQSQSSNDSGDICAVSSLGPHLSSLVSARPGRQKKKKKKSLLRSLFGCVNSSATIFAVTLWPAGRISTRLLTFSVSKILYAHRLVSSRRQGRQFSFVWFHPSENFWVHYSGGRIALGRRRTKTFFFSGDFWITDRQSSVAQLV